MNPNFHLSRKTDLLPYDRKLKYLIQLKYLVFIGIIKINRSNSSISTADRLYIKHSPLYIYQSELLQEAYNLLFDDLSQLFVLNYLPLLLRHPIKPINNLIYLFICDRNFPLDLFALSRWRKGVFLFVQVEHTVNEGDELVVDGFFGGVVEVDSADGKFLGTDVYIVKSATNCELIVENINVIRDEFKIPRRYFDSIGII